MRTPRLVAVIGALTILGGLVVAAPTQAAAPTAHSVTGFHAVVSKKVGGSWSVQFLDGKKSVVATVTKKALALVTPDGRVPADRVLSVKGDAVEVGTRDAALSATVTVKPAGDGIYAVAVTGHGDGITGVSLDLQATRSEHYLGMGERSDAVDHRGKEVLNRVVDGPYTAKQQALIPAFIPSAGFSPRQDATYFPVPWILSTAGYGVLVDDDEDSTFELATPRHRKVSRVTVDADHLDLRIFNGPTPAKALTRMTAAIGRQPAPSSPMVDGVWWHAQTMSHTATELEAQRAADVPVTVALGDTHFLPCGVQQTEKEKALTQSVHDLGAAATAYFNPMVCTSYEPAYDDGTAAGAFTKSLDGTPITYYYQTSTRFQVTQVDFSGEAGRTFFENLLSEAVDDGYDGWMEDFGEYTPDDAVSADGTSGAAMHNRYVEQYHATGRDFETTAPRPLLRFERSGWTGAIPNASIVWGGDPTQGWGFDGLSSSVYQGLTMGTSGVSIWGPDIGGFFAIGGEPRTTAELLDRWIEYGAFTGVMRLQPSGIMVGATGTRAKITDPDVAPIWKTYARLRTSLYPYIAGSQDAYEKTGIPLMRQLALMYPRDDKAITTDDEYMYGKDVLVAPVVTQGATSRKVYLPQGSWIELARAWKVDADGTITLRATKPISGGRTVTAKAPLDTIPLFVRVGAVLPMLPKTVDTLSTYGTGVTHLSDVARQRTLVAAPRLGRWHGVLGEGESMTSTVTTKSWTVKLAASQARTYDVEATLAGLGAAWKPCRVETGGKQVAFSYDAKSRVLQFSADVPATGSVTVAACRVNGR